jgi:hypothetical protein
MKRMIFSSLLLLMSIWVESQTLPTFSSNSNEVWYYIQFQRGLCVLQDMGESTDLNTQVAVKGSKSQLWKVVGDKSNFELVSQNGRHVYCKGTTNGSMFAASSSKTGNLALHATTTEFAPAWEIQINGASGHSMNQFGGYGAGRSLGLWNADDINDPLQFVLPKDLTVTDTPPTTLSEYAVNGVSSYTPENKFTLWYQTPVTKATCSDPWMDYALPIGNGQLGGMVYGGIHRDMIQFNDKTLWAGSSTTRGAYQTFGNLYMEDTSSDLSGGANNYLMQLNLEKAMATASYTSKKSGVKYTREYIASYPDQCIAIHLYADKEGMIDQHIFIYNPNGSAPKYADGGGTFSGKETTVSYNAHFKVSATGGTVTTDSLGVHVTNADDILITLSAGTDYDPKASGYVSGTSLLADKIKSKADNAAQKGWLALITDHLADYHTLYNRVNLSLDGAANDIPTNALIDSYKTTATTAQKRMLEQLYFQYGRYLLIASSRGVDLPNNLQGIWNNSNNPGWQCDMHANINVQMNYWPAEKTNLSELHLKYLNYLYNMAQVQPQWQGYAKDRCGQTTGWANFTENNIFGHCTTWHNDYVEAGAWACSHLWQHYRYTLDKEFLKTTAMPVMLSCVKFWMERLVKDSKDGTWVCPNEWSPEHGPDKTITAHAQQIVWNLFSNTIDAVNVLGAMTSGITDSYFQEIKDKFAHLDNGLHTETYNGTYGATRNEVQTGESILREWKYVNYATGNGSESNHRHISHLMVLYPLNNISSTSPYFLPSIRSLRLRGLQSQGWSMGWKMNLWARAHEADSCQAIFALAFRHSADYVINMSSTAGGVYYNLFDSHSPFQIDGNFGVCAGMAEMMIQSDRDTIMLLPAVSRAWSKGSVTGLKVENNFTVSENWTANHLTSVTVLSGSGKDCILSYQNIASAAVTADGVTVTPVVLSPSMISFPTAVDKSYTITFPDGDVSSPGRQRINMNRTWKFHLGDVNGAEQTSYNADNWNDVNLPHSFSIPYFMWHDVYHGYGWYRKTLNVDNTLRNKELVLEFEGSFIQTELYVNGHKVGAHSGGYTTFSFDITPYIVDGENTIAVRVNNLWNARVAPRAGDHQFSGGIYRDVWLNATDKLHVDVNGTFVKTPVVSATSAVCQVATDICNSYTKTKTAALKTTIYDPSDTQVATADTTISIAGDALKTVSQTLPAISNPQLWSPATPSLYKAVTTLSIDDTEVDSYRTTFGIRTMVWTADKGFFLNGTHLYLLGANVHQDQAGWGDAVANTAMARDVQMIKDAGFNCIRGSHYPHDCAFAHACDSIGVILFMEFNNWGMGGNQDEGAWGEGAPASSYPTVAADQPYYNANVLTQLKEMIHAHRNSPAIAAWSMCNEPFFCSSSVDDKMRALLRTQTDSATLWDGTRQIAIGGAQRKDIDKLGKNQIAFYNGDGASLSNCQNPGVPNLVSEYGSTIADRPGTFAPGWGNVGNGMTNRPTWRSGQVVWCGFDHGTVGGQGLAKMGLIDYFRLPKRSYYWYKQAYHDGIAAPVEPEWPKNGTPAKLQLSTSNTTIPSCDGTADAQLIVTIEDANGKHISNSVPVTLTIKSGPGEFPTGTSITFTPPTSTNPAQASTNSACDIRIMDGQAAIAFRSYYAGTTVIEATADGLTSDRITLTTLGTPRWSEGVDKPVGNRPYKRFSAADTITTEHSIMTLAADRPTMSSSDLDGCNKKYANDGNTTTQWKPDAADNDRWWQVSLEDQYTVNRIELTFPTADNYKYLIQVSSDGTTWRTVVNQSETELKTQVRMAIGRFGENITDIRVKFTTPLAGLSEVRVGGMKAKNTLPGNFISGTIIGTEGSWGGNATTTKTSAIDFDYTTFFDGPSGGSPFWVGLDLGYGMEASLTNIAFMPRYNPNSPNFAERMIGGKFQIADNPSFTDAKTVYTITTAPTYNVLTTVTPTDKTTKVRYVRYLSTDAGNGNVAEIYFYGTQTQPDGIQPITLSSPTIDTHHYSLDGMLLPKNYICHGIIVSKGKKSIMGR